MGARQHPFDLLMELDGADIKLDCAALHLSRDVYPHIDMQAYQRKLDLLADEIAAMRPGLDAVRRYEAMREVLVNRHAFTGNSDDYYDPDNSYLNRVLERHLGVPISLSIVWLEVGRRLKWPISGVGFPAHFLVRFDDPDRFVVADPFHDGRSMSLEDCQQLLKDLDLEIKLEPEHLLPIDTRQMLIRLLANLRQIYLINHDWKRLVPVLRRMAAVEPKNGTHLCELASVHARRGDMKRAYAHLAVYLERLPNGDDREMVRHNLQRLEAAISALN